MRTEFRSHLNVNAEQEEEFMLQWTDYAAHLATEAVSDINVFVKGSSAPDNRFIYLTCRRSKMKMNKKGFVWPRTRPTGS